MRTPIRILVFEPDASGHQMEYLRYLLMGIERDVLDARVILLTTAEAAEHPNCRRLSADFSHLVDLRIAPRIAGGHRFFRALGEFYEKQWMTAERLAGGLAAIGAGNLDFILLPHLECIGLLHLGLRPNLFHGLPWASITIATRFHHRSCGVKGPFRWIDLIQRAFFHRVIRRSDCTCLATIDPYFVQAANRPNVAYSPDPCAPPVLDDPATARAAYGIRPDTCLVLVFGVIDRRKCIDLLIAGASRVTDDVDLTILSAGPQHKGHVGAILAGPDAARLRARGRLVEVDRFLLNGKDIDPMSAADIAWVFYERHFVASSSVLVRSALSGLPVLVRRQGVIGRLVSDAGCGIALEDATPDAIASALTTLARDPERRRTMGMKGAAAFSGNTPENFARPIVDAINRRLDQRGRLSHNSAATAAGR